MLPPSCASRSALTRSERRAFCLAKVFAVPGTLIGIFSFLRALPAGHPSLEPATLLLTGCSLWLAVSGEASGWKPRASRACAAAASGLGLADVLHALFFPALHHSGEPLFESGLLLVAAALLLLDSAADAVQPVSQGLAFASAMIALISLLGSAYGVASPALISTGLNASPLSALALLFLSAGALCARPDRGWMAALTSAAAGGRMARRLLPAAILVPALLGEIKVLAVGFGWSGAGLGPLMVIMLIILFSAIIVSNANLILREERARQAVERALRDSQEQVQAIIDNTPAMIFLKSLDGRFLLVNRQYEKVSGKTRAEVLGKTFHEVFPLEAADALLAMELQALAAGKALEFETSWPGGDGRSTYLTALFPVLGNSARPRALGGVSIDISQRKRIEEDLLRARDELQKAVQEKTARLEETGEQLIQAQKMEAVGRLAGGVAHDFNNILTAIGGFSELLLSNLALNDPRREEVQEIRSAGQRAAGLTRQLLAFSRKQFLQPKSLSPNALVADFQKMLKRLIGEDIELRVRLGENVGAVYADPGQLEQVLLNLVVNARDAMPRGGTLTLSTASAVLDEAFAAASPGAKPGPCAMFSVADTGIGMDARTLAHLFEPFFTTKEKGKGTGLGLSTAYGIVKQSGGYIKVESALGAGTTFRVYLPLGKDAPEASAAPAAAATERGTGVILLVEDDNAVRKPLRRYLDLSGYKVLEAADGQQALRLAQGHAGPIDLLLTDVVMPGQPGHALAKQLLASRPGMKIIFMTGYIEAGGWLADIPRGSLLLQKPFEFSILGQKIRQLVGGKAASP